MKKIITDCDGVLLDWCFAFDVYMREQGYVRLPNTDQYFEQSKRYGIPEVEALEQVHKFNETGALGLFQRIKIVLNMLPDFLEKDGDLKL